jgi:hypothetical protein
LNVAQVAGALQPAHHGRSFDLLAVSHDCIPLFDCVMDGPVCRPLR